MEKRLNTDININTSIVLLFSSTFIQLKQLFLPIHTAIIAINNIHKKSYEIPARENIHNSICLNTQFSLGACQQHIQMGGKTLFPSLDLTSSHSQVTFLLPYNSYTKREKAIMWIL